MTFVPKKYNNPSFYFKVQLLKKFWETRDKNLIPANKTYGLRQHKFLFFYNVFAKLEGKQYSLDNLKAFADGPVFNDIYFENAKFDRNLTDITIPSEFLLSNIDLEILELTNLLVASLTDTEISNLTHTFDCWKENWHVDDKGRVDLSMSNDISEDNFSDRDNKFIIDLNGYIRDLSKSRKLYKSKNNVLAIAKKSYEKLVNEYKDDLDLIQEGYNPVFVELDEQTGKILYDY